jgi:hypothetical protein
MKLHLFQTSVVAGGEWAVLFMEGNLNNKKTHQIQIVISILNSKWRDTVLCGFYIYVDTGLLIEILI